MKPKMMNGKTEPPPPSLSPEPSSVVEVEVGPGIKRIGVAFPSITTCLTSCLREIACPDTWISLLGLNRAPPKKNCDDEDAVYVFPRNTNPGTINPGAVVVVGTNIG